MMVIQSTRLKILVQDNFAAVCSNSGQVLAVIKTEECEHVYAPERTSGMLARSDAPIKFQVGKCRPIKHQSRTKSHMVLPR